MKKITSLLLAALLALSLAACGEDTAGSEDTTGGDTTVGDSTVGDTTAEPEPTAGPETTKTPETTKAPEATKAPETTAAPGETAGVTKTLTFGIGTSSVDESEKLGYKWDMSTATLTLCGIDMKVENGLAIKLDCDATVEIADGTVNTIVVEGNDADLNCCAIVCTGDLTVTGKGTLNITSGDYDNFLVDTGVTAYGIAAKDKTLLIEDGTLNISCGTKGANDANLRNIQGLRAGTVQVEGGKITIETGDCYTTTKGAFLDGIYTTVEYIQEGGEVSIAIGDSCIFGASVFLENLAICSDGGFTMEGGTLTAVGGANTENGKAIGAKTIDFGSAKIAAGADEKGTETSYTAQKYVKAAY